MLGLFLLLQVQEQRWASVFGAPPLSPEPVQPTRTPSPERSNSNLASSADIQSYLFGQQQRDFSEMREERSSRVAHLGLEAHNVFTVDNRERPCLASGMAGVPPHTLPHTHPTHTHPTTSCIPVPMSQRCQGRLVAGDGPQGTTFI